MSMKKTILVAALFACSAATQAATFECYRYVNGEPTGGWIKVEASSKEDAAIQAVKRFKEIGGEVHSAKCNYA